MPQPTLTQRHVDQPLTDYSRAYLQESGLFAARRAFPVKASPFQSNKYYVYDKDHFFRSDTAKRAPGSESAVRGYELSRDTFFCDRYSIAHDVTEEDVANSDSVLDAEQDGVRLIMQDLAINEEVQFAATAFTTGVWGTDQTGGTNFTVWSDPTSDPIGDIAAGQKTILQNTGKRGNVLVIGAATWFDGLMNHPDIVGRLPDNAPRFVTEQFLANLFGVDEVIMAGATRNTADENATAAYSFILGSNALLIHRAMNPGPRQATAGLTFVWSGLLGNTEGVRMKRIEIPEKSIISRVEGDSAFDHKVVASDLGYYWSGAVA